MNGLLDKDKYISLDFEKLELMFLTFALTKGLIKKIISKISNRLISNRNNSHLDIIVKFAVPISCSENIWWPLSYSKKYSEDNKMD